jgi:hypothetical protein
MSNNSTARDTVTFSQELSQDGESWIATCSALPDLSCSGVGPDEALASLMVLVRDLRMAELIFSRSLPSGQVEEIMRLGDGQRDRGNLTSTA